ncbi:hypothetical protein CYMTET_31994, partial [Cymbomonas tetramitiformis]
MRSRGLTDFVVSKLGFFPPKPPTYEYVIQDNVYHFADGWQPPAPVGQHLHMISTKAKQRIPVLHLLHPDSVGVTILFSHGNAVDLGIIRDQLLLLCTELRVNVFSYDYSGFGQASGMMGNHFIFLEEKRDQSELMSGAMSEAGKMASHLSERIQDIGRDARPAGWQGVDQEAGSERGEPAEGPLVALTQVPSIGGSQDEGDSGSASAASQVASTQILSADDILMELVDPLLLTSEREVFKQAQGPDWGRVVGVVGGGGVRHLVDVGMPHLGRHHAGAEVAWEGKSLGGHMAPSLVGASFVRVMLDEGPASQAASSWNMSLEDIPMELDELLSPSSEWEAVSCGLGGTGDALPSGGLLWTWWDRARLSLRRSPVDLVDRDAFPQAVPVDSGGTGDALPQAAPGLGGTGDALPSGGLLWTWWDRGRPSLRRSPVDLVG